MAIELGIAAGLLAAVFGLIDWRTKPVGGARTMGLVHAIINLGAVVIFGLIVPDGGVLALAIASVCVVGEAIDRLASARTHRAAPRAHRPTIATHSR